MKRPRPRKRTLLMVLLLLTGSAIINVAVAWGCSAVDPRQMESEADGISLLSRLSSNGQFVVFCSSATNLVNDDTNKKSDIFRFDRATNSVSRIRVGPKGLQANDFSISCAVSSDGEIVAFDSYASNLVSNDLNKTSDIFVHNCISNETERVSVNSQGMEANGGSSNPSVAADGQTIAFCSMATNLAEGDNNHESDVYVRDLRHGRTELVTKHADGSIPNGGTFSPMISGNGRFVLFSTTSREFSDNDRNNLLDLYLFDRSDEHVERISRSYSGADTDGDSTAGGISSDGRYILFRSLASNIVKDDTNGKEDVFLLDRDTKEMRRISVGADGAEGDGSSGRFGLALSSDGRFAAFVSEAKNLTKVRTTSKVESFLFDRDHSVLQLIRIPTDIADQSVSCVVEDIGSDGKLISFASSLSNISGANTNGTPQVFVLDWASGQVAVASRSIRPR